MDSLYPNAHMFCWFLSSLGFNKKCLTPVVLKLRGGFLGADYNASRQILDQILAEENRPRC